MTKVDQIFEPFSFYTYRCKKGYEICCTLVQAVDLRRGAINGNPGPERSSGK